MSARPVLENSLELEIMMRKRSERWRPTVAAIAGGSLSGLGNPERWFFQIPNCAHCQALVNNKNISKGKIEWGIRTNSDLSNTPTQSSIHASQVASILSPLCSPCPLVQQLPVFGKATLRLCWLVPRMKLSTYCTRPDGPTFPRQHCEQDNPRWIIRSHHKIKGWSLLSFFLPGSWSCWSIRMADST
ncbi:hypothetical protein PEX1_015800 [Penicillium expansum]|uniref:Uncharacterized protein n=1 Tax=Penicillium expansum TaxID=27334 RepID=A0A0A2KUP6_PENEN|nr:hypothetical protein PEX2_000400 [Penicillium expansum]KGO43409.1 hypothetical protein PEXP_097000 [Penicillium expansum]KGO57365.1 hypothetical protein PEX2_000400 [Penicillium expansum]KGO71552.1 hypothetical protein PEX1_015800 [Penicillium expansum]